MRTSFVVVLFGITCSQLSLCQEPPCNVANPSRYFRTVSASDRPTPITFAGGYPISNDCEAVLNARPLPTSIQGGLIATLQLSDLPPEGYGFFSVRSKTKGSSSSQGLLLVIPAGWFSSVVWAPDSGALYAVQTELLDPGTVVRLDPKNRTVMGRSGAMPRPRVVVLDGGGSGLWVSTDAGGSVTYVSIPGLEIGQSIPMPAGKVAQRLWGIPWLPGCFVADLFSLDTIGQTPGDLQMYCSGTALSGILPVSERIRALLFEKSGEAWAYSEKQERLFSLRVDQSGLALSGPGIAMPPGGSRLIGGFGRIYFGKRVFRKDKSTVTIGPEIDSVLGVDEELGIVYAGRNYRGVFQFSPTTMLLRVSRDPDLRDVLSVFNRANYQPATAVPEADLVTFAPGPHGQYAFLDADDSARRQPLYILQLGGAGKKLSLSPEGVLHAASLRSGPVAPGSILSLFGEDIGPSAPVSVPLPVNGAIGQRGWDEWGVTFDGVPAVPLFGSQGQLNVIVPDSVRQSKSTEIRVINGAFASAPVRQQVVLRQPAFFTAAALGGAAIAVFPDGQIAGAGRDAKAGDLVSLFGTGFGGPSDFGLTDGAVVKELRELDHNRLQVSVCGKPAEVSFAGLAPGSLFGLFQFNIRIPQCDKPANGRASLLATIDGISSPEGVFLPIQ